MTRISPTMVTGTKTTHRTMTSRPTAVPPDTPKALRLNSTAAS